MYRLLEKGEVLQEGDELYIGPDKGWTITNDVGWEVRGHPVYRRKIAAVREPQIIDTVPQDINLLLKRIEALQAARPDVSADVIQELYEQVEAHIYRPLRNKIKKDFDIWERLEALEEQNALSGELQKRFLKRIAALEAQSKDKEPRSCSTCKLMDGMKGSENDDALWLCKSKSGMIGRLPDNVAKRTDPHECPEWEPKEGT